MSPRIVLASIALLCSVLETQAADWPQFRGPQRDGVSKETGLRQSWPDGGPPLLWTFSDAGFGYSGPAVIGDRLYMSGGRANSDAVFALDIKAAPKELWSVKIGPLFTWRGNNWNMGPNATPTVDGDLVYALGGSGD